MNVSDTDSNDEINVNDDTEIQVNTFSIIELHRNRIAMLESMTDTQQLLVKNTTDYYKDKTDLSCKLSVSFDGEQGVGVSGLTKEFFSLFWKTLS